MDMKKKNFVRTIAVLHSGDLDNVSIGGVSQYIQEMIRHEVNYKIILFGTCETGKYELGKRYECEIDQKKYTFIPITDNRKTPLSIYYFFAVRKYLQYIEECDVIYCQRMEYILPFCGRKSRIKTVMAVHGSGAYTLLWRGKAVALLYNILERFAVKISGKVIVLQKREEYGVPYYKKRYHHEADKIFFGRVPIDEKVFYKIDRSRLPKSTCKKIIYLGRIDDNPKRIMLFPEIAEKLKLKNINFSFLIIGDGPSMDSFKVKIKNYKVEDKFKILGKIEHSPVLTRLLNQGDVALILSKFEGICMSALECIACGVPVVATDVGDIKEYIKDGINGIVIPNDNKVVDNTVHSIEKIFQNGCETNKVYLEYSAKNMIEELERIFEGEN